MLGSQADPSRPGSPHFPTPAKSSLPILPAWSHSQTRTPLSQDIFHAHTRPACIRTHSFLPRCGTAGRNPGADTCISCIHSRLFQAYKNNTRMSHPMAQHHTPYVFFAFFRAFFAALFCSLLGLPPSDWFRLGVLWPEVCWAAASVPLPAGESPYPDHILVSSRRT